MARSSSGESVLTRIVRILQLFTAGSEALTASEVARRADLPVATAHRMINELVEHGVLERTSGRQVRMGVRMWEWASRASHAVDLRQAAMPAMGDLQSLVRQHTQIGVLEGTDVLYLERLSAPDAVQNITKIAGRLPIHATSAGLILLAHAAPELQEEVLAGPLRRFTPRTVCEPTELRRLLADIRRNGYVMAEQMITPGALGLGAPVHGRDGSVVAALCLVVPAETDQRRQYLGALLATARSVSRSLGAAQHQGDVIRTRGPSSAGRASH